MSGFNVYIRGGNGVREGTLKSQPGLLLGDQLVGVTKFPVKRRGKDVEHPTVHCCIRPPQPPHRTKSTGDKGGNKTNTGCVA